jgi:hypothetical protein
MTERTQSHTGFTTEVAECSVVDAEILAIEPQDHVDAEVIAPAPSPIVDATIVPPQPPISNQQSAIPNLTPPPDKWKPRSFLVWAWHGTWWFGEMLFGWLSSLLGLSLLATIPLVQFITLGYMLECSGRVARKGRFRDGFVDLDKWARIGSLVAGSWLMLVPLRFVAGLANDAALASAQPSVTAAAWRIGLIVLTVVTVGHILLAWYSGGKLRHFFWPLIAPFSLAQWVVTRKIVGPIVRPAVQWLSPKLADDLYQPAPLSSWFPPAILLAGILRGPVRMYTEARDAVWDFTVSLNLPYYFWLGLRGFVGASIWLFLPVVMLIASTKLKNDGLAFLISMAGAIALANVLLYLPFLQAQFAAENRFAAMFNFFTIRKLFRKAPVAFWFALLITLALALPPYLFKIQQVYAEFYWLFSFFFVLLVYPGRLLAGWAIGLANKRERNRFILTRLLLWSGAFAVSFAYVFFVFLSQYTSWNGSWSLFEQHPFLVPAPFFGG